MRIKIGHLFIFISLILGISIRTSYAGLNQFDISNSSVGLDEFMSGGPPKDGIPSLDKPHFIEATEAVFLNDDDMVVGLVVNGKARAYPIRILNWHEIVNDQIAKTPVAVTWCPLTKSAGRLIPGR